MIPTLPFMYIIIAITIADLFKFLKKRLPKTYYKYTIISFISFIIILSLTHTFSYLITVLKPQDTRITAANFAEQNIPNDAKILSEVYDLGITPFNSYFSDITLFNAYEIENDESEKFSKVSQYDYIVIPSQRVIKSRLSNSKQFKKGHIFYNNLLNEKLGFSKIYETPFK